MADTLLPGQLLAPGRSLTSQDGAFQLIYQMDGNLVIYRIADGRAIWDTKTAITRPGAAIMQTDGDFVLYKADGAGPYWATGTNRPNSYLKLSDYFGTLDVVDSENAHVWASTVVAGGPLQVGGYLLPGGVLSSPSGHYWLNYRPDGNLVIERPADWSQIWESRTTGKSAGFTLMQWNGNFVVYGPGGHEAWWASGTHAPGGSVAMQDDGNLVVYDHYGNALWASDTKQPPLPEAVLFGLDYNENRDTRIGHSDGPLRGSAAITSVTNKTGYTVELAYTIDNIVAASALLSNGGSTNAFNGRNVTADWAGTVQSPDGGPNHNIAPFEIQYE